MSGGQPRRSADHAWCQCQQPVGCLWHTAMMSYQPEIVPNTCLNHLDSQPYCPGGKARGHTKQVICRHNQLVNRMFKMYRRLPVFT